MNNHQAALARTVVELLGIARNDAEVLLDMLGRTKELGSPTVSRVAGRLKAGYETGEE